MDTRNLPVEHYDEAGNLVSSETIVVDNPDRLLERALTDIDAITNLADAKAFLRKLVRLLNRVLQNG